MMPFSSSLSKRIISGFIFSPIVLGAAFYGSWPFALLLLALGLRTQFEWGRLSAFFDWAFLWWILGFVYIGLTFTACYMLRLNYGPMMTFGFFILVWGSDIGGYIFGKIIGGIKMSPTISPNKTWAGYAGSLLFPAILAATFFSDHTSLYIAFIFGALLGLTGQSGDLLVSWVKRRAGVKDSGQIIPGHGGLLDRVDSLMLCAPVFLGFVIWVTP